MPSKPNKTSWNDVKTKLTDFDRTALLDLLQALYKANKDTQTFLHARLNLGNDVLKPYKVEIDRWLCPDVYKNGETSIAKAKKPIADYKKAIGNPAGLAELMVFYCEQAADFSDDYGVSNEGYVDALARMFEQALKIISTLAEAQRDPFWDRLASVRDTSHNFGYGIGEEMDGLLEKYDVDD
jgi:hypothetical protein